MAVTIGRAAGRAGIGGGGGGSASSLELTAEAGETIAPATYVNGAGRQWLNDTVAPITVPATITEATMTAAGFTDIIDAGQKWADFVSVQHGADLLALPALAKPYLRVRRADTDEVYMQIMQPPTNLANWLLIGSSRFERFFSQENSPENPRDGDEWFLPSENVRHVFQGGVWVEDA